MGAYLSTPRTEKDSSDEKTDEMLCGASSMQGWRINQEVSGERWWWLSGRFRFIINSRSQ